LFFISVQRMQWSTSRKCIRTCVIFIYTDDLIDVFGNFLSFKLFADDVKIYAVLDSNVKVHLLQEGLNRLKS